MLVGERQKPRTFTTAPNIELFIGMSSVLQKQNRHTQDYHDLTSELL